MSLPLEPLRVIALRELSRTRSRPLFVTISGAHLYGFASPDSDFDVRGCHLLPVRSLLSLSRPPETTELSGREEDRDIDFVSHDARKFFRLMLNRNGYVLEQVFSPLVVIGGPELEELREIARGCVTRGLHHHYRGFFETQLGLHERESVKKVKTILYLYRVLLTGIHVLRTGSVESNLHVLLDAYPGVAGVRDLVGAKTRELATLPGSEIDHHRKGIEGLRAGLDEALERSTLPELPTRKADLEAFLIRSRARELESDGIPHSL